MTRLPTARLGARPRRASSLRRGRSALAGAQRRFNALAHDDAALNDAPGRAPYARERLPGEVSLKPLTHEARAMYEAGVVPVTRDPAKAARQQARYREGQR